MRVKRFLRSGVLAFDGVLHQQTRLAFVGVAREKEGWFTLRCCRLIYPGFTIVNPRALSVGGGALPFLDYSYTWASQEYRLNSVPNEELRRFGLTREHLNVAFENYNLQQARFQQYKSSVVSTTTSLIVGVGRDLLKRTAIEGLKRLPRFIPTRFFK